MMIHSDLKLSLRSVLICNLVAVVAILLGEKFAIGAHVYGAVKQADPSFLSDLLFNHGKSLSRTLFLSLVVFAILIQGQLKDYRKLYLNHYSVSQFYFMPLQLLCFGLFYLLTHKAFPIGSPQPVYQVLWLAAGVALVTFTALSVASRSFWALVFRQHKWHLLSALAISYGVWWLGVSTQSLWSYLSDITFSCVAFMLSLFSDGIHLDFGKRVIGLNGFLVSVDTQCSGYEGIGLVISFISIFLYSFRNEFRFPRSLWLFPIGIATIWLFNLLRIVVLIFIGSYWSEEVAVWGFHSQAGWIAFILTSLGIMMLAHNSRFFSKSQAKPSLTHKQPMGLPLATLIPLLALLAMTFLTQALSGQFDWLYPLRVVVVGAAVLYCMKHLDFFPMQWSYVSVLAGAVVTVLWIWMVPTDTEADQLIGSTLAESSGSLALFWLVCRFIGTVITVPIAEELGFRGYLLCKLAGKEVVTRGNIEFSIVAVVASSLAFGLLHGAWLAGTVAGLIYAFVRYKSTHVLDAIIAHGTTNMLLFIYAFYSGQWSLL
ncbi:exosortase E/protease, VPEID-CTERM system [Ketobacter sp.]|uniref:exosortase E/protease, VPEID-CTERM system n=1 Tax=Ketobacter sp. TaxID=2083498 RepID=UPI000F258CE5|nr:exosortase E/protease, VPEID-CTERM system [Ketobacter sp.]RLT95967.1 MAG: exosortase E/protease, VPEID-CTERM system [Ketobacter sp.]